MKSSEKKNNLIFSWLMEVVEQHIKNDMKKTDKLGKHQTLQSIKIYNPSIRNHISKNLIS